MKASTLEKDDPDRERECLIALRSHFRDLAATAAEAGWSKEEVAFGLLELSRHEVRNLIKLGDQTKSADEPMEDSCL